jgi:hypothetical protein
LRTADLFAAREATGILSAKLIGPIVSAFSDTERAVRRRKPDSIIAQVDASGTLMLANDWATTMAIPIGFMVWSLDRKPYTDAPADFLHIR